MHACMPCLLTRPNLFVEITVFAAETKERGQDDDDEKKCEHSTIVPDLCEKPNLPDGKME